MSKGRVETKTDGEVLTILMNRPEKRNAVDGPMAAELLAAFERFEADACAARRRALRAPAAIFAQGADLAAMGDPARRNALDPQGAGAGPMGPTRLALSKPLIAAVSGYAVAGGLELALLADLRVVERDATFGVFCRRWGVPLIDGGTVRLPRLIGMGRALDLILTGRAVGAEEALAIGLANRIVAPGEALAAAEALARELAAFPQECMLADRRSAYAQWDLPLDEALRREGAARRRDRDARGRRRRGALRRRRGRHGTFEKCVRAGVIPAQAGIDCTTRSPGTVWIPACAGMTLGHLDSRQALARAVQRLSKYFGALRARHAEALGEDEEGHAGDAEALGFSDLGAHGVFVGAFLEELGDDRLVEPAFARGVDEKLAVADVAPLLEIELEQAVDDLVLRAGGKGPADQPMRVQRVGRALDLVEGEGDAFLGAERAQPLMRGLDAPVVAELVDHVSLPVETLPRDARIELIGPPADRDGLALVAGERPLEPLLAEIAPGADDVADDIDRERLGLVAHVTSPTPDMRLNARSRPFAPPRVRIDAEQRRLVGTAEPGRIGDPLIAARRYRGTI